MKRGMGSRGGSVKGRIKQASNSGSPQNQGLTGLYLHDRLVNAVTSVLGCTGKVTGKNGKQFEGVFKTISPEASLVFSKACVVEAQKQNGETVGAREKPEIFEQFIIHHKDWVRTEFKDVNLEDSKKDTFKTDGAISGIKQLQLKTAEKELQRWDSGNEGVALETKELEGHHSMENGWTAEDMFQTNEKMYGVKSTYNEDMEEYTTKLDKSDTPEYREREKIAAQKAAEICKESLLESHADCGKTEEQLYSTVLSSGKRSYVDKKPEQTIAKIVSEDVSSPDKEIHMKEEVASLEADKSIECAGNVTTVERLPPQIPQVFTDVKTPNLQGVPTDTTLQSLSFDSFQDSAKAATVTNIPPASKDPAKVETIANFKEWSHNFQLAEEVTKVTKVKKVKHEEKQELSAKDEKEKETPDEPDLEKKNTTVLNPNAQEFRPRAKRNTPSPRSVSSTSMSGTTSAPNNTPFTVSPYPPNYIYNRNQRARAIHPDYIETGFVNATNATGQPLFAQVPAPMFPQPSHGLSYAPHASLRHPGGIPQHMLFQQHPHQGTMILPVGQVQPGYENPIYFGHAMPTMIQSPPQISSPSIQQSQFNFPPALSQSVNPVRPVTPQPPTVSPPQAVYIVRNPNSEIQPTQIMSSRPQQTQNFQGN